MADVPVEISEGFRPDYDVGDMSLEDLWLEMQKLQRELAVVQATLALLCAEDGDLR
jgi:hypothetical protein